MGPVWGPAAVGAILGAAYAALNRMGMKRIWRAPHAPLNVVVTGGTKGLGKAMAREFLRCSLNFRDAAKCHDLHARALYMSPGRYLGTSYVPGTVLYVLKHCM